MSSAQVIADSSTRVIAIANQKGGVGKTTTTVNLGAALAEMGQRVLLIDLDPQANASTGLGINPRSIEKNMYDVLLADTPLEDTIEPAPDVEGLFLAPSSLDLAGAEIELVPGFNRERRLIDALSPIVDDYDFVFIDCPPSLGLLTINALVAATEVLVPIQCEYYALEGVGQLVRNVELVRKSLNPSLEISTIVLVMYDARTKLAGQVVDEVRAHFGEIVCKIVIPRVVRLSEAPSYGQPITVFDPENRGAQAYRDLANEVLGNELDLDESPAQAPIQPGIGLASSPVVEPDDTAQDSRVEETVSELEVSEEEDEALERDDVDAGSGSFDEDDISDGEAQSNEDVLGGVKSDLEALVATTETAEQRETAEQEETADEVLDLREREERDDEDRVTTEAEDTELGAVPSMPSPNPVMDLIQPHDKQGDRS